MVKKIAAGLVILVLVAGAGLFFWARSVLGTDTVRTALASQLSQALGQPVSVDSVSASIYPRVTVKLTGVTIGEQGRVKVKSVDVGTALGALLSRRIEHASLRVNEAHLELPLPDLALGTGATESTGSEPAGSSPVELVSVDEVVLSGIELVNRGRTLRGDIDIVPHGTSGFTIRKVALTADDAHIDATGEITDLAGPVGTIDLRAGALDLDQLTAFLSDFSEGTSTAGTAGSAPQSTAPSTVDLTVTLAADKASMAGLSLDHVEGTAHVKGDIVSLDPLSFNLFGGSYKGALGATLGETPSFSWKAALNNVDVAAVMAFAGDPGVLTGRLAARVDLTGTGLDAAAAMKTARGTATLTIANGVVQNLALVKSAVAATSLDPQAVLASSQAPRDEPFSELGATLAIAGGAASTQDLHFVSQDIRLDAAGALKLDGSAVSLKGQVQLSEELSKQANSTIARATSQDGRITLPASVTGVAGKYSIQIDTTGLAKRALTNEAKSQAQQAIKKGFGLLRR